MYLYADILQIYNHRIIMCVCYINPLSVICFRPYRIHQASYICHSYAIHIYSGITSGRVRDGELLYTKILEVNLFAFAYRLSQEDFSAGRRLKRNLYETVCRQMQIN